MRIDKMDKKDLWFINRHGKFTSSEIWKLIPTAKDGRGFSQTGWTYIEQKAMESETVLWERPELEYVEALFHGKMFEQPAYEHYVRMTGNTSMRHFGSEEPVYLDYNKYSGGSPDGLMGQDTTIHIGLEIKCPKNSNNHWKYCKMKDQFDLKQIRPEYYAQVQHLLMITKAPVWHWFSYDERFKNQNKRGKLIEVFPDQKFQDNLEVRIKMAQKEKLKIIEEFNNS